MMKKEKTPIYVLSDRNKRLLARSFLHYFSEKLPLFTKSMLLQSESFPTVFYTVNSSPVLATESVFKLIFVMSIYQTCTFSLKKGRNNTTTLLGLFYQ